MFLHIGLGRAGSSYLQKKVFSNFKDINYISRYNSKSFDKKRIKLFYDPTFFSQKKYIKNNTFVSTENFFHSITSINKLTYEIDCLCKDPKIIIILRNPLDHLISTYKTGVISGNLWMRIDDYFNFEKTSRARIIEPNKIFSKSFYEYNKLIKLLKKRYVVKVFYYEKIFKNHTSMNNFIKDLSNFFQKKYIGEIKEKDFYKINSSLNEKFIKNLRIQNFKKVNGKAINKLSLSKNYFESYISNSFIKKFHSDIKYRYKKI